MSIVYMCAYIITIMLNISVIIDVNFPPKLLQYYYFDTK